MDRPTPGMGNEQASMSELLMRLYADGRTLLLAEASVIEGRARRRAKHALPFIVRMGAGIAMLIVATLLAVLAVTIALSLAVGPLAAVLAVAVLVGVAGWALVVSSRRRLRSLFATGLLDGLESQDR